MKPQISYIEFNKLCIKGWINRRLKVILESLEIIVNEDKINEDYFGEFNIKGRIDRKLKVIIKILENMTNENENWIKGGRKNK